MLFFKAILQKRFYLLLYSYTQTNKYDGIITIDRLICKEKPMEKNCIYVVFQFFLRLLENVLFCYKSMRFLQEIVIKRFKAYLYISE